MVYRKRAGIQIVSFEHAERLKKLGYDIGTRMAYRPDGTLYDTGILWFNNTQELCYPFNKETYLVAAPPVVYALQWLREEKEFVTGIVFKNKKNGSIVYGFFYEKNDMTCLTQGKKFYKTYELAESALLDELLNILERKS